VSYASTRRARAGADIALMSLWLLSFIWVWAKAFPGAFYVCVAGYALLIHASRRAAGDSLRDVGFRLDTVGPALWRVAFLVAIFGGGAVAVGWALGSLSFDPAAKWPNRLAWGALWGFAQQVGLLAFFYRRFVELLRSERLAAPAAGVTFALFHLPNPFLVALTAILGTIAALMYRRAPNRWVYGAAHGLTSWMVSRSLPASVTHLMRVGPGYWSMAG
jgi:hypothetical protein